MQNNQKNWQGPEQGGQEQNHRIGRELYNRDQQRGQGNQHRSDHQEPRWDLDNNFHTGYSNQTRSHFPEDNHQRTSNADLGASRAKHYGTREYSSYRSDHSLNYGDGRGNSPRDPQQEQRRTGNSQNYSAFGDGRGNYSARQDSEGRGHDYIHSESVSPQRRRDDSNENYYRGAYMDDRGVKKERPRPEDNPYNEYPGSRSRYKDDDYRYGSGNHSWQEERRYTTNEGRRVDPDKGDILHEIGSGAKEVWRDVKNTFTGSDDRDRDDRHRYSNDRNDRGSYTISSRSDRSTDRNHDHEYRSRRDQGTERGPRWSDETDTGDDSFFYSDGNRPRYY